MTANTEQERAILYKGFCEWCKTVPHLDLDPRLHTHGGRIEDGGYISDTATAKAFAAWRAARRAPVVPQSIEQMAVDRYKVVPSHRSMFYPCAVVAGDGQQQLYIGREVECQNMAIKFTGVFLDGAFVALTGENPWE